jgi:DNA-binding MarR family transcriptional regulator
MNNTAPPLAPLIGQTENTLRAILNRQLAGTEVTYPQWTALILTAAAGGPVGHDQLTTGLAGALQADQVTAGSHIDALAASGLVQATPGPSSCIALTEAGQQLLSRVQKQTGEITQRLWGDLPAADLEATRRVLSTVLERAQAELKARS